jgi:selenocysteine lyase/cysteine desulfurase
MQRLVRSSSRSDSQSGPSAQAAQGVAGVRREVLRYFNADAALYTCIFTSGATASAKLVGELFAWSAQSRHGLFSRFHFFVILFFVI